MKRNVILAVCATVLVSSCQTYAGAGAYTGTTLGSILGSAIGGLADGPRGSDIGTIIGMAGGAVVGSAIGTSMDRKREADLGQYRRDKAERMRQRRQQDNSRNDVYNYSQPDEEGSGFDENNGGDDRIYDFNGPDYTAPESGQQPTATLPSASSVEEIAQGLAYTPAIEIRNARFVDADGDNAISRGELCKVIFEVMNRSRQPLYDIQPTVVETTGNRHLYISPGMHVEKIDPGKGIRYTALVKADNRLKDGTARICASVIQGNNEKISKVSEFNIPTRR